MRQRRDETNLNCSFSHKNVYCYVHKVNKNQIIITKILDNRFYVHLIINIVKVFIYFFKLLFPLRIFIDLQRGLFFFYERMANYMLNFIKRNPFKWLSIMLCQLTEACKSSDTITM